MTAAQMLMVDETKFVSVLSVFNFCFQFVFLPDNDIVLMASRNSVLNSLLDALWYGLQGTYK